MIVFDAFVNGKRLCRAGAADMSTLYACLGWVAGAGRDGRPTSAREKRKAALWLHLEGRAVASYRLWSKISLKVGDQVRLKVVETTQADAPSEEHLDTAHARDKMERSLYRRLKRRFEGAKTKPRARR